MSLHESWKELVYGKPRAKPPKPNEASPDPTMPMETSFKPAHRRGGWKINQPPILEYRNANMRIVDLPIRDPNNPPKKFHGTFKGLPLHDTTKLKRR